MARWISGIILAGAVMALLLFAPIAAALYFIIALSAVGALEFISLFGLHPKPLRMLAAIFAASGTSLFLFLPIEMHPQLVTLALAVFFMLGCVAHFFQNDEPAKLFQQILVFQFGVFYCALFFGFLGMIVQAPFHPFWIFFILATTFLADTGAYVAGKLFGRHKIAPRLSPKKTWEGLLGGILLAAVGGVGVSWIFRSHIPLLEPAILGGLLAITGFFGDLTESLFKRAAGVKDSGNLIPGHGGLLDRIDALLFNAPLVAAAIWFLG